MTSKSYVVAVSYTQPGLAFPGVATPSHQHFRIIYNAPDKVETLTRTNQPVGFQIGTTLYGPASFNLDNHGKWLELQVPPAENPFPFQAETAMLLLTSVRRVVGQGNQFQASTHYSESNTSPTPWPMGGGAVHVSMEATVRAGRVVMVDLHFSSKTKTIDDVLQFSDFGGAPHVAPPRGVIADPCAGPAPAPSSHESIYCGSG